ncbi:glutamine amidotransferase-related protein [Anaeromyxobacter oryzae]|uniref:GMP synthase n=1 Tax=Anaeromyxobacter oryzae TaxID=2918170 RepID=A0ABM7WWS8_9BACT|nr:gamma-glutamyl-gamma-aminobutyrate hydrolase family protein [Anaeromyxobacter oryzae]BDG03951.1 GMP synthase [Anaeromyxobacter oryzae]
MPRVLVIRTGSAPDDVRAAHGDFTEWFAALLAPAAVVAADAEPAGALPDARGLDGVVVTGSLASVTRPEPWMDALGGWLLAAAEQIPVLGVCFGHQLLGHALGVRVERNPRGPEAGTREVTLTRAGRADPLFQGLPERLAVQQSHSDHVPALPPGAVLLAGNGHAPVQAFGHGPRIRAVQFHPEFDAARTRALCESERELLDAARPGLAVEALSSIRETPEAARILANWRAGLGGA